MKGGSPIASAEPPDGWPPFERGDSVVGPGDGSSGRRVCVAVRLRAVRIDDVETPYAREPHKVTAWNWFDLASLPEPLLGPAASIVQRAATPRVRSGYREASGG